MADDTRLADACLLLNYSNQSYKEQLQLNKRLQQTNETADSEALEHRCRSEDIKPAPLPTDSNEMTASNLKESPFDDNYITLSTNGNIIPSSESQTYSLSEKQAAEVLVSNSQFEGSPTRDRIDDLFAAVNCALPDLKTYHTSSSSSSPQIQTGHVLCPPHLPDHDYCLRSHAIPSNPIPTTPEPRVVHLKTRDQSKQDPKTESNNANLNILSRTTRQKHSVHEDCPEQGQFSSEISKKPLKLVAIHLGAGHAHNEIESLSLAKQFCEEVMLQLPSAPDLLCKKKRKSPSNSRENTALMADIWNRSAPIDQPMNAEIAVVQLIKLMEDHQSLNCGFGSNLNIKGQVECDASMMSDSNQMWAGVGSVSGCRNPILLVKSLFDARTVPRPLGLIQPNLLVGSGAKQWMREHCPSLSIIDSKMISSRAFSTYQKLKSRYDSALKIGPYDSDQSRIITESVSAVDGSSTMIDDLSVNPISSSEVKNSIADHRSKPVRRSFVSLNLDHGFYCARVRENLKKQVRFAQSTRDSDLENEQSRIQQRQQQPDPNSDYVMTMQDFHLDTVGAVAVDSDNNFASAISSGGLLLKYKGRVGQAAIPGAGCWSENSVAITTTGVGEYLTLSLFAKRIYEKMQTLRLLYDLGHVEKKSDQSNIISSTIDECFEDLVKSPALAYVPASERLAGLLSVSALNSRDSPNRVEEKDLYLSYAHNTRSMCLGYMTCDDIVGHSVMSRQLNGETGVGDGSIVVKTIKFSLDQQQV